MEEDRVLIGKLILTVEDGALRVDFDEKNWRKRYMVLTGSQVKEYAGNELDVYLTERIHEQKDYPEKLVFRPGTMIVENGDSRHVFAVSDGQVLLTHGEHKTKADRFVFDLTTYEVVSPE